MTKPTNNTIRKILEWKTKNRLTDEEFEKAGFNEIIEIIKDQDNDIEIAKQEEVQDYLLEHVTNDETVNYGILVLKGLKPPKEDEKETK